MPTNFKHELNLYCRGKKWYVYIPFFLFTAYFLFQVSHFKFGSNIVPGILVPFGMLDFGIHELGHWITIWLPQVVCASMGVGLEVLFPILIVYAAFKYKQYFLGAMCLSYVALAMSSGGQYMADARSMRVPLVSMDGSDNAVHDWNFVFGKLHLLPYDHLIGNLFRGIGFAAGLAGLAFGCYLIIKMAAAADVPAGNTGDTAPGTPAGKPHPLMQSVGIYPQVPAMGEPIKTPPAPAVPKAVSDLYPTVLHGRLADNSGPPPKK